MRPAPVPEALRREPAFRAGYLARTAVTLLEELAYLLEETRLARRDPEAAAALRGLVAQLRGDLDYLGLPAADPPLRALARSSAALRRLTRHARA